MGGVVCGWVAERVTRPPEFCYVGEGLATPAATYYSDNLFRSFQRTHPLCAVPLGIVNVPLEEAVEVEPLFSGTT